MKLVLFSTTIIFKTVEIEHRNNLFGLFTVLFITILQDVSAFLKNQRILL